MVEDDVPDIEFLRKQKRRSINLYVQLVCSTVDYISIGMNLYKMHIYCPNACHKPIPIDTRQCVILIFQPLFSLFL